MKTTGARLSTARRLLGIGAALLFLPVFAIGTYAAAGGQANITSIRQATAKYHDVNAAIADGYAPFYICTDQTGVGAMGQHFVKGDLVKDPAIDPLHPEALVYEPRPNGGYKLVAVEYVTFQQAWHDKFGAGTTPTVIGQVLKPVGAGNRYGLDPFFQRHIWLWANNPLGMYEDWNSKVTCRGKGDPA